MGKKTNSKQAIVELCRAHEELAHTRKLHENKPDSSNILTDIFDQQLRTIETEITTLVKAWLGCTKLT